MSDSRFKEALDWFIEVTGESTWEKHHLNSIKEALKLSDELQSNPYKPVEEPFGVDVAKEIKDYTSFMCGWCGYTGKLQFNECPRCNRINH